jgi:hypothetical protein
LRFTGFISVMSEVLKLRGAAAFSANRLARLTRNVQSALPRLKGLAAEHWYFVELNAPLAAADLARLQDLLGAHPAGKEPAGTLKLVTPRLGTISPWSSKATEIARQCGFAAVTRIERGTTFHLDAKGDLAAAARPHDRVGARFGGCRRSPVSPLRAAAPGDGGCGGQRPRSARAACASWRSGSAGEGSRASMNARTADSGRAPVNSLTILPSTTAFTAGMPRTPNCAASAWFSSEFTLARRKRPWYSSASFSRTGPRLRQGPHQGAQKSARTGTRREASTTSYMKLASVTSMAWDVMSQTDGLLPQGDEFAPICCEVMPCSEANYPLLLDLEIQSGNQPVDPFDARSPCIPALSFETERIEFSSRNDNLFPAWNMKVNVGR